MKQFEIPQIEIVRFSVEDIVTTSTTNELPVLTLDDKTIIGQ